VEPRRLRQFWTNIAAAKPQDNDSREKILKVASFRILHYFMVEKGRSVMPEPIIAQKSPFVQKAEAGTFCWCACGRSKSQPFCDGSHKGTGFTPKQADITEAKTVAWCGCKHSKNAPFCDGSHSRLG
jgi:CDGSH-type Zn-finger protein